MSLTDEQKKLRATGIGASEAPTLVGVGPGKLVKIWQKRIDPDSEEAVIEEANDLIELGEEYEDPTCRVYAKRTGTFLAKVDTLRHPTKPLALATPDRARFTSESIFGAIAHGRITSHAGLEGADRLVEAKTTGSRYRRDYGRAGSGVVPEEKALQCIWQMGVTGLRVVDLPVCFMGEWGRKVEVFTVHWNESLFDWMYEAAERFWRDYVVTKKPPPPDGSEEYDEAQARAFPRDTRPTGVATEADEALMLRYAKFREVARRAELLKKREGQALKNIIGDTAGLVSATLGKLSWTRSRDTSEVDWEQAAQNALNLGGLCLQAFDTLKKHGEQISDANRAQLEARLKAIVPDATKPKPGYRSLRFYPKAGSEADLELAQLRLALDALEEGT